MKKFLCLIVALFFIISFYSCIGINNADDDISEFSSYAEIINLYHQMANNCINYNEQKHVNGEYENSFDFSNDSQREWYRSIFKSMIIFGNKDRSSYGYSIGDIDQNGTDELLLMYNDYTLIALFSISENKPILLDTFWNRNRGNIDADGLIHISSSSGADHSTNSIYKISSDGSKLELICEIGTDGVYDDTNETKYYKLLSSDKEYISKTEYFDILTREPFENNKTSSIDNKNVKFIPLFK